MPKKLSTEHAKETRSKSWTFVLYEDSAPENWKELLDEQHIQWAESPWHDKDVNANGEPKKKHKHIALSFGSLKSYEQVKELTDSCKAPIPQRCHDLRGLIRYMAHLDNPEKAQYDIADIIGHGGMDIKELLRPSSSERYSLIGDMIRFCKENHISEYQDLMDYAIVEHFDDWFPLLCDSCTIVLQSYIKSIRHRTSIPNSLSKHTESFSELSCDTSSSNDTSVSENDNTGSVLAVQEDDNDDDFAIIDPDTGEMIF